MKKNIIIGILVIIIGITGFLMLQNQKTEIDDTKNQDNTLNKIITSESKVLVVYFSAQSHTETVAKKIAENLNADIFEIIPEVPYTEDDLNYNDNNSRVVKEHDSDTLKDVKLKTTTVENWESYDVVLIGYPIWFGTSAWPTNSFVKSNDFTGKTVIPFCTSGSSEIGQSGKLLEESTQGGDWLEGKRFSSNVSDSEIKNWTDSLTN